MQRTGTTSVGEFFKLNGYKVADWYVSNHNKWSHDWGNGDFEKIFNSKNFKDNQVFEDDPWWLPEFYKVLYHRFPDAKFILLTRNSDKWFQSLLNHSDGQTLGNTELHCKAYRRENDFYNLKKNKLQYKEETADNLLPLVGYEEHYKSIYETRNREVINFFNKNNPTALFVGELEDSSKWQKLGIFMNIEIAEDFDIHANKSKT